MKLAASGEDSARRLADKLIAERNQYYNAYGIAGFMALFQVDPDRVARLREEFPALANRRL